MHSGERQSKHDLRQFEIGRAAGFLYFAANKALDFITQRTYRQQIADTLVNHDMRLFVQRIELLVFTQNVQR